MKVLLSGASSFTGYWFGKALAEAGHQVTGLFRGSSKADYQGIRAVRIGKFEEFARREFGCTFGEARFLEVVASQPWDVYCHHASDVSNYRSPDFDPLAATGSNTHNLKQVLSSLKDTGCEKIVVTGTVFERGEGIGSDDLPAISRYGLSKTLSWEVFLFECLEQGFHLGKFVIPNPFGPLEEPKFTAYLSGCWKNGEAASCRTPQYVRDNIPVDLLALEYARFVTHQPTGLSKRHPSGYVESQGRFTERVADELRKRTGWACELTPTRQTEFSEPLIRTNSETSAVRQPDWDEKHFWDQFAEFHSTTQ